MSQDEPPPSAEDPRAPAEEPNQSRLARLARLVERFRGLGTLQKIVVGAAGVITAVAGAVAVGNQAVRGTQNAFEEPPPPARVHVETNPTRIGIPVRETALQTARTAVRVERDPKIFEQGEVDWTGYRYVIPRAAGKLPPPPRGLCRDRARWAYGLGGADAGFTRVQVTIEGNSAGTVLIDAIEATVERRRKPLAGVLANCPVGGATGEPRRIQVDLDRKPPEAQYLEVGGDPTISPVVFTLKRGEAETFFVDAYAQSCYCEWRVEFKLIAGGKRSIVTVPPLDNPPFRTTGIGNAKPVDWRDGRWR